jgi:adenylate kinase
VIELHSSTEGGPNLQESLREACISAAMESQHTVVVVSNHSHFSFQEWDNLVTVMGEGGCGNHSHFSFQEWD